jgi:hypothetical protein
MFGLLKGCYMDAGDRNKWHSFYCGLCLSLNSCSGNLTRLLTNSEGVLLSVLTDAQSPQFATLREHRCLFRNFRSVQIVEPAGDAGKYAALVSLLIGSSKLLDHLVDRDTYVKYFPVIARKIADRWIRSARGLAAELGVDTFPIEAQLNRQIQLEKEPNRDFLFYSQAVEAAGAVACSNTAVIAQRPQNIVPLQEIGELYGRIIYLLDSYRDYRRDMKLNKFNPLAQTIPINNIRNETQALFEHAYTELVRRLHMLDLVRNEFCEALFTNYVWKAGSLLLGANPAGASPSEPREKRRWCEWCECCECCGYCDVCCEAGSCLGDCCSD